MLFFHSQVKKMIGDITKYLLIGLPLHVFFLVHWIFLNVPQFNWNDN